MTILFLASLKLVNIMFQFCDVLSFGVRRLYLGPFMIASVSAERDLEDAKEPDHREEQEDVRVFNGHYSETGH